MASKKIFGVIFGLSFIAITMLLGGQLRAKKVDPHLKKPLFEARRAGDITLIEMTKADKKLRLLRGDDNVWHIGDAVTGKPADAARVVRLLDDLARIQFDQIVGRTQDGEAEFGLLSPTILNIEAKGEAVSRLHLGQERRGGGQYVSIPGQTTIYLTGSSLPMDLEDKGWEAPEPPPAPVPQAGGGAGQENASHSDAASHLNPSKATQTP
jgi:hypothetical protein